MKGRDSTEKSDETRGLSFAQAVDLVGEAGLKEAAKPSRFSNWKHGRQPVPWFVVGPLLLLKLSTGTKGATARGTDSAALSPSQSGLRRVPMPRPLQIVQDLVAAVYFHYGPESKQMKAITDVVELAAPEATVIAADKPKRAARPKT